MTVRVRVLTGPHAGRERVMPEWVDPLTLLGEFARADTRWAIDYSAASVAEILDWGRADMMCRITAALIHGRVVRFDDPAKEKGAREWTLAAQSDLPRVLQEVEDVVANSGCNIFVARDDDNGVLIGVFGPETPMQ